MPRIYSSLVLLDFNEWLAWVNEPDNIATATWDLKKGQADLSPPKSSNYPPIFPLSRFQIVLRSAMQCLCKFVAKRSFKFFDWLPALN